MAKTSFENISWSGLLGKEVSTIDNKHMITGYLKNCASPSTLKQVWSAVLWSLMALQQGAFPTLDCEGNEWPILSDGYKRRGNTLAGGLIGVVWVLKGDHEWIASSLGLEHYGGRYPCPWCRANTVEDRDEPFAIMWDEEPRPWSDIAPTARWRATVWNGATDFDAWRASHDGPDVCPIFHLPGFSIANLAADSLHILDQGVLQHVLGNTLFEMTYETWIFPNGATRADRLDELWSLVDRQYVLRGTPCRLGSLERTWFCDVKSPHTSHPCLSTRVKAAETRHLLPIVAYIWSCRHDPTSAHQSRVNKMLSSIVAALDCMDCDSYQLPRTQQQQLERNFTDFFFHYRHLKAEAIRDGRKRWHEVPKFHFAQHIVLQSRLQGPRWGWTYPDEDYEGLLKDVCQKCQAGTPFHNVVAKAVRRCGYGVALRAMLHAGGNLQ